MQLNDAKSQRVTVKRAADLLGATPEAIRARLFGGTLEREEGDRGIVYVRLHANHLRSRADQAGAQAPLAPYLLERLLDEIATCGGACVRQQNEIGRTEASSRP